MTCYTALPLCGTHSPQCFGFAQALNAASPEDRRDQKMRLEAVLSIDLGVQRGLGRQLNLKVPPHLQGSRPTSLSSILAQALGQWASQLPPAWGEAGFAVRFLQLRLALSAPAPRTGDMRKEM